MTEAIYQKIASVEGYLRPLGSVKIAVSGGVDSMTLAILAGRIPGQNTVVFHAISPAVPPEATHRVRGIAGREDWRLREIDAGEFADEDYLQNPYTRCFHCKKNLYGVLARELSGTILSGTNADDMADFRPGLEAARQFAVRHPFVACGITKIDIRRICRILGYAELAELPASPCLSSRMETGLRIDPAALRFVHRVERELRHSLQPAVVRCRIRHREIAVELDTESLAVLSQSQEDAWKERIGSLARHLGLPPMVTVQAYRMGSAFVSPA